MFFLKKSLISGCSTSEVAGMQELNARIEPSLKPCFSETQLTTSLMSGGIDTLPLQYLYRSVDKWSVA